jgi:hypothetical protein
MRRISDISTTDGQDVEAGARGLRRGRRTLALLGSLTLLALAALSLAAAGAFAPPRAPSPPVPPSPPAPSITTRPANPSNQTSAHFAYADAQSGVGYECQLDSGSSSSCPAIGITYTGLAQGSHSFRVRAVAGTKTSATSTSLWTIDTVAPTASISHPSDGATLNAAEWGSHCDGASICGEARDAHGVSGVQISIRRDGGEWWSGSAFDQPSESFRKATLSSEGDSAHWSYALQLPPDGQYTIHVRATDAAGNTTPATAQATSGFTVDTTPPPTPTIAAGPQATTTARTATFVFADAEHGARLLCRRDGSRFSACTSPQSYGSLSLGSHRFEVEALDAVGNASAPAGYSWTIAKSVEGGKPFTVSGNASGPLAPGVTRTLAITITNPNSVAIEVTTLTVSVAAGSSNAGCDGPSNLQLTQSDVSSSNPLAIPAGAHVALPTGTVHAPEALMRDLSTNQDACKNATFTFSYSGSAHS